jgi:hypothetical protein
MNSARLARVVCISLMIGSTIAALILYGLLFDSLSEDDLVQISFVWVGLIAFGIGGLILARKGLGWAIAIGLVFALAAYLALQTFYLTVWQNL